VRRALSICCERARGRLPRRGGPAAAGAIIGSSIPLATDLSETWQYAVLAAAAVALLVLHQGIVLTLLAACTIWHEVAI
jgi:hypothetical protein